MITELCAMLTLLLSGLSGGGDEDEKAKFEVVLKSGALARSTEVTLADVADVLPPGREAKALGATVIGKAPTLGWTRSLTRHELLQALVLAGHDAGRFTFKGPREVVVQSVHVDLPMQEVLDRAEAVLRAAIEQDPEADVEIELASRPRRTQVPPGRTGMDFRPRVRDDRVSASSAIVDVQILVDGEEYRVLPLHYRLTRYHMVLKTTRSLRAGSPLGPDSLELSRERVASTRGLYVQSFDEVKGTIARRDLQANKLLTLSDLGQPALIHKGQLVTVVISRGRIKVTAKAIANHDAARGEVVSLTNLVSRQPITGVAWAPGTVVIPTDG